MSKQATHRGTCQLCAHDQKLPGNRLSLHGYTVQWGFFSGTCPGSRGMPYELSCDLIAEAIASQKVAIKSQRKFAAEQRALTAEVWVTERRYDARGYNAPALVRKIAADQIAFKYHGVVWMGYNGKQQSTSVKADSAIDAIIEMNGRRADAILAEVAQRQTYVEWLTKRQASWALKPLTEIPAEERGSKAPNIHGYSDHYKGAYCASSMMGARRLGNWTREWSSVTCGKCIKQHDAAIARAATRQ